MTKKEKEKLFREKAETYLVCFNEKCSVRDHCLRWEVGEYVTSRYIAVTSINPKKVNDGGADCPQYRDDKPTRHAIGMTNFYYDMPNWMEYSIRRQFYQIFKRFRYFKYRNGSLPIPPKAQQQMEEVCRRHGWKKPLRFDGYEESLEW